MNILVSALMGFACLMCGMLSVGALALALCWETVYRIPGATALVGLYGLRAAFARHRFTNLSALGGQSFAATRAELAADLALLRSKL